MSARKEKIWLDLRLYFYSAVRLSCWQQQYSNLPLAYDFAENHSVHKNVRKRETQVKAHRSIHNFLAAIEFEFLHQE